MENHESDIEGSVSGPENDMSEGEDDDSRSDHSRSEQRIKSSIDPDVLTRLKQGMPFVQEDFERSFPFHLFPPHMITTHLAAAAAAVKEKDGLHRAGFPDFSQERSPPLRGYPEETLPANQAPPSDSSTSSTSSQQTWSFEEQFKQLYELSDDVKRKEFLDELFSFMQKRGTPINRLPIMAKQVLDLYELYNLVIARGGLVDVINKKLWQEIIKGLHLPSSITSAAFTLRTQYMKYLYPFECEKKRLSTPAELQAAIDGNRREGRRQSYGPYPDMISPLSLVGGRQVNGNGNSHPLHSTSPGSPPSSNQTPNIRDTFAAMELSRVTALWSLYQGGAALPDPKIPPLQDEALNLEVPTRNSEGAQTPKSEKENGKRHDNHHSNSNGGAPPLKRMAMDEAETPVSRARDRESANPMNGASLTGGTHIKINSRGDGRGGVDTSLVVSMEINGIMYQGVLFAQAPQATRVS